MSEKNWFPEDIRENLGMGGGLSYEPDDKPPEFGRVMAVDPDGRGDVDPAAFDERTAGMRRARARASVDLLFRTDVSKLSENSAAALYGVVTEGLFGLPDNDGTVAFGSRASKSPFDNLNMLRRFCNGEYSLIEDPEYTKWREMDEEARFRYALEKESTPNKAASWFKGERGAGFLENLRAGAGMSIPGLPAGAVGFQPRHIREQNLKIAEESARRSSYETLTDEEKAAYRADVIGDYEEKLSRRQTLATFLQYSQGLSDKAAYLLAKSFNEGAIDMNVETLADKDERARVYSAFSLMRGDQKRGRILGIETDFTDDTVLNRAQLALYGFQQGVLGLATDTWRFANDAGLTVYAKTMMDDAERKSMYDGWNAIVRAEQAAKQNLPEAETFLGAVVQGTAENLHWAIPYGGILKGGRMMKTARAGGSLKKEKAALEAGRVLFAADAERAVAAAVSKYSFADAALVPEGLASIVAPRQIAAIERYTQAIRGIDKAIEGAKWWKDAAGAAMWWAGEASSFGAFASEYVANADAAGISREESVLTAAAIGLVNAQIERLYVPGLESSLTPQQLKSLSWTAAIRALHGEGAAGFRRWLGNYVSKGAVHLAKTVATESFIEETLQQIVMEHGKAFDMVCEELRANGQATFANEAKAAWANVAPRAKDWATFIDTAVDSIATGVGFGITEVGRQKRMQHLHNIWMRHVNRRAGAGAADTMQNLYFRGGDFTKAVDCDIGIVDMLQQSLNAQAAVDNYWKESGDKRRGNPGGFDEAFSAARRAWRNPQGGDSVRNVAEAAGVDVKTAEVMIQFFRSEAEAAAFSPKARAIASQDLSDVQLDENTIRTVLSGNYVEGSYASDPERGVHMAKVKLADGTTRTIAYIHGDISSIAKEQAEANAREDSALGASYDERMEQEGRPERWASIGAAERYDIALRSVNGFSSGEGGVFLVEDANGKKAFVQADDVIYLANGRLGDIGYGAAATMTTARHETFHSIWRFIRATLEDADVQRLAKTLGIDVTDAKWEAKLDEAMAHQMEQYASGHYVTREVSGRIDGMLRGWAGKAIELASKFRPVDDVLDPETGKPFQLKGFYDKILRGELGSGDLGVELRKVPAAPATPDKSVPADSGKSSMPVEVTDAERAEHDRTLREEGEGEADESAQTPEPAPGMNEEASAGDSGGSGESSAASSPAVNAATAENPADASVPNQRYYRIGLPDSGVKLVGRLEVRDADEGVTTSTDEGYRDRGNQNRDDQSEESRALVEKIAGSPDPMQIATVQPLANNGIVWALPNGDVIIGNHRVNGVRAGYAKGNAAALEKFVREDAAKRGIEIGENVKSPLLVFVLERIESPDGKADVHEVVRLANESANRGFNIREQAGNDAKILLDNNLLPLMSFRADGRIDETESADALGAFRRATGMQGMIAEDGSLTEEGQTRITNAALAALLGGGANNALLTKIMSNPGRLDMKSQLRALMAMTPELMDIAAQKPAYDLREPLAEALELFTAWRDRDETERIGKGRTRRDWRKTDESGKRVRGISWQEHLAQGDMFRKPTAEAKILGDLFAKTEQLRSFDGEDVESEAGKKRVVDLVKGYLADYIKNVREVNTESEDIFGTPPATRAEIMDIQRQKPPFPGAGARFSVSAEDAQRQYDEVVRRYTNADGTKKRGWMRAPNGRPTRLTERQWVQVRTPAFKEWFGDWEADAELAPSDMAGAKSSFKGLMSGNAEIRTADGATLRFVSQSAKAYSKEAERESSSKTAHWAAVANIESLVARSRFMFEEKPRNGSPDIAGYVKYGSVFSFGGEKYLAKITSKRYAGRDAQNFYSVESVSVEKIDARGIHEAIAKGQPLDASDKGKISNILAAGKGENAVSKVVDENDEPLVVYRGSEFDPLAMPDGEGVVKPEAYFTADPEYAKRYTGNGGRVRAYYLNIRNPFDIRRPECLADLQKIYPEHNFARGTSGALDWGEESVVEGEFLRDNFGDKYDGLIFDEGGDPGENGVSYRGISYVPLDGGAQVKSATDNTGAFDRGNNDIRYSVNPFRQIGAQSQRAVRELAEGRDAVIRNSYGDIEYNIGKPGKFNTTGKIKGGYGLMHIVYARMAKDGATLEEALHVAMLVADALETGGEAHVSGNKHYFRKGDIEAVFAINTETQKPVLTGYKIREDESDAAIRASSDLRTVPPPRKEDVVASLRHIIQNSPVAEQGKNSRYSVAARLDEERRELEAKGGALLLAHHGTDSAGFTVFEKTDDMGYFFAKSRSTAGSYIQSGSRDDVDRKALPDYMELVAFAENEASGPLVDKGWGIERGDGTLRELLFIDEAEAKAFAEKSRAAGMDEKVVPAKLYNGTYYREADRLPYDELVQDYNDYNGSSGVYDVALRMENTYIIDCHGANWDSIIDWEGAEDIPDTVVYDKIHLEEDDGHYYLELRKHGQEESQYESFATVEDAAQWAEKELGEEIARRLRDAEPEFLKDPYSGGRTQLTICDGESGWVKPVEEDDGWYLEPKSTRNIVAEAFADPDCDGVIFKNVVDSGGGVVDAGEDDVYVVRKSKQVKLVDEMTYADDGSIIPAEKRLDWSKQDIRYSVVATDNRDVAVLDRQDEIAKIDLNDKKSLRDYLVGKVGQQLLDNFVVGDELPDEYVYSPSARGNNARVRKAKAKLATALDEAAQSADAPISEAAKHKKREGGKYYRRAFAFAVPSGHGGEYRAYTADLVSYMKDGTERLYDVVNMEDAPGTSADLARFIAEEPARIAPEGTSRIPAESGATPHILPNSPAAAQGGNLRESDSVSAPLVRAMKERAERPQAQPAPRYSVSIVKPWPEDFPHATLMTTRAALMVKHADLFLRAKAGDAEAAANLIDALMSNPKRRNKVLQLKKDHPDAAIAAPVHAEEASGRNALPFAYAQYISDALGMEVDDTIVQTVKAGHTGSDAWHRLTHRAQFEGEVESGKEYILVDDHITQGGTINELRSYIENNGGKVVAVAALTASKGSAILSPSKEAIDELKARYPDIDQLLRDGDIAGSVEAITNSEAEYIKSFSPDTFRNRIAQAKQERTARETEEPLGASASGGRRHSVAVPRRRGVYPGLLNTLSDDALLSAAVAAKIALGKSDAPAEKSIKINTVNAMVRRLHPGWDDRKVGVESLRVLSGARDLARKIREDLDRGVSESLVVKHLPDALRLETQGLEKGEGAGWTIFPKALTPRVKNERDFDTSADIFSVWASRMEEAAQWKHHARLGLELRAPCPRHTATCGKRSKTILTDDFTSNLHLKTGCGRP